MCRNQALYDVFDGVPGAATYEQCWHWMNQLNSSLMTFYPLGSSAAVLWLASDEARHHNRQCVTVDAGYLTR